MQGPQLQQHKQQHRHDQVSPFLNGTDTDFSSVHAQCCYTTPGLPPPHAMYTVMCLMIRPSSPLLRHTGLWSARNMQASQLCATPFSACQHNSVAAQPDLRAEVACQHLNSAHGVPLLPRLHWSHQPCIMPVHHTIPMLHTQHLQCSASSTCKSTPPAPHLT